ncbi:ester cyclase [Rhodococcus koreensis]
MDVDALTAMRRYAFGFVNSHDFEVCRQIMTADYTLHYGADVVAGRDDNYIPAVQHQMAQFPNLGYAIHDLISDGEWTGVCFSEHGASARDPDREAAWLGIGLYRFDGERLAEAWVEQDHYARRRQLESEVSVGLPPVAVDPWTHAIQSAEVGVAEAFSAWWSGLVTWPPTDLACTVDPGDHGADQPSLESIDVSLDRQVVSGSRIAFHVTISGLYRGGLPGYEEEGQRVEHYVAGFATVSEDAVSDMLLVTHRIGLQRQLGSARPAS